MSLFKCKFKVPFHASLKNDKKIRKAGKRSFLAKSERQAFIEGFMNHYLVRAKMKNQIFEPIDCEIQLKLTFYFCDQKFYTKKGAKNKTVHDLSNLYGMVEDCLQKVRIIDNDRQVESHDGSRKKASGDEFNYLEIEIIEY